MGAGHVLAKEERRPWRVIHGAARTITDYDGEIRLLATQYSDGTLADIGIQVFTADDDLNSDQARELAAALLEAAAQVDGLVTR
jgi:hypothetical protein